VCQQTRARPAGFDARRLETARDQQHLHFPNKTIQRCAQFPNNSCTIAVGTKSFPAPVSNVVCSVYSVRSLLRQPRSALEAGPSEAHAISFVLTPRPHLHRTGCAVFSASGFPARTKGIMGNVTFIGLKRHPFSGPVDSVGELLHTP